MPLSEDEQRILKEIEHQFYATDPAFAREVGTTSLYRHHLRHLKLSGAVFAVGTIALVYALWMGNFLLSFFAGAVPMFFSVIWFERHLRKLGKAGLQQVTSNMKAAGLRDAFGTASKRARDRFRRDDEPE